MVYFNFLALYIFYIAICVEGLSYCCKDKRLSYFSESPDTFFFYINSIYVTGKPFVFSQCVVYKEQITLVIQNQANYCSQLSDCQPVSCLSNSQVSFLF